MTQPYAHRPEVSLVYRLAIVWLLGCLLCLGCSGSEPAGPPTPGPLSRLVVVEGNNQIGVVGAQLALPLGVRATDAAGVPIAGLLVSFQVTSGGGIFFTGTGQTNVAGEVRDRWTLGTSTSTSHNARARAVDPVTGAAAEATFEATARPGTVSNLATVSGSAQRATGGKELAAPIVVRARDQFQNVVPGAVVGWWVIRGGGAVAPAQTSTDSQGLAQARWTLGSEGVQELRATAAEVGVFISATLIGPPSVAHKVSGDQQFAQPGAPLVNPLVVRFNDAAGLAVPGAQVTWTVAGGGGAVTPASESTDSLGVARASWTLGASGSQVVTASSGSVTATFTASLTGVPATLLRLAGNGQSGIASRALPIPLTVRVLDVMGNPVPGATVAWAVTAGAGSLSPTSSTADSKGEASSVWTLGEPGPQAAKAVVGSLQAVFDAEANAPPVVPVWSTLPNMPVAVRATAAAAMDGRIHVVGGYHLTGSVQTHQVFDLATQSWSEAPPAPTAVEFAALAVSVDGLHLLGGSTVTGETSQHWVYKPGSGQWEPRPGLPTALDAAAAVTMGGKIYVFGGGKGSLILDGVFVYDPVARTWSNAPAMPRGRLSAAAAVMGDEIILAGGIAEGRQGSVIVHAFQPATGTWRVLPNLPEGREAHGAVLIGGQYCVVGGRLERNRTPYSSVQCLSPGGSGWTLSTPMARPRPEFGYATVGGVLYVLGGQLETRASTSQADRLVPP